MRIVIDTNVVISAIFFKGKPFELLNMTVTNSRGIKCYASPSIIDEYIEIFRRMIDKKGKSKPKGDPLAHFIDLLLIIEDTNTIQISRDIDDDKFINCALNCKALYIVSGDSDLLDIKEFEGVKIIKVDEFLRIIEDEGQKTV